MLNSKSHIIQVLYLLFITAVFSSCSGFKSNFIRKQDQPYIQVDSKETLDKYKLETYKVQARDLLSVSLNSPDLNTNLYFNREGSSNRINQPNSISLYFTGYLVSDSGYINLPMIGKHSVVNRTAEDIEDSISKELSKYLKEFSVSVKLANFRITLLGEVSQPGTYYFYESKVTLLQALSMAGDFDEYANRSKLRIVRDLPEKTLTFEIDLKNKDFLSSQEFILRTGDIIYVEPLKSKVFSANRNVLTIVISSITAALTLYRIIQTQ